MQPQKSFGNIKNCASAIIFSYFSDSQCRPDIAAFLMD